MALRKRDLSKTVFKNVKKCNNQKFWDNDRMINRYNLNMGLFR